MPFTLLFSHQLNQPQLSLFATRAGQQAAAKSLWVMGAGVAVSGAGAFGGIATAAGLFVKATKSFSAGNNTATSLYTLSGMSFVGQSTTSLIQFVGAFSDFMVAKGSQRFVWVAGQEFAKSAAKGVALRTGGRLIGGAVVGGLSLTGLGLIFLAGGLIFEAGVLLLTPDALQKHIQNSYFGKGGNEADRYKTLADEEQGVRQLTQQPPAAEPPEELPYADPMTGWMMGP